MNEKELIPLWDMDLLRYRCGFAADSQIKSEAKAYSPDATEEEIGQMLMATDYQDKALQNVKTVIEHVNERFNAEKAQYYVDGERNFRYNIATLKPYKGNRDKTHKPKYYNEIKDYVINVWKAETVEDIEVDDRIGILQYAADPDTTVIVSNDKDMRQIPGWHFNWVKGELSYVTPDEADFMFFWQMMVGDTSDNIPGINKIGEKTATKIIAAAPDLHSVRETVKDLYKSQYGDSWGMAYDEVAHLLYIRRTEDPQCPLL